MTNPVLCPILSSSSRLCKKSVTGGSRTQTKILGEALALMMAHNMANQKWSREKDFVGFPSSTPHASFPVPTLHYNSDSETYVLLENLQIISDQINPISTSVTSANDITAFSINPAQFKQSDLAGLLNHGPSNPSDQPQNNRRVRRKSTAVDANQVDRYCKTGSRSKTVTAKGTSPLTSIGRILTAQHHISGRELSLICPECF